MPAPRSNAAHDDNWVPSLIGVSTADGKTPIPVEVDPTNGALLVSGATGGGGGGGSATVVGIGPLGFNSSPYDTVSYANTSATVDTYSYFAGGTGGTKVATVTITYTDSSKTQIATAART